MSDMFRRMLRAQNSRIEREIKELVCNYDFEHMLGNSLNAHVAASNLSAIPQYHNVRNYAPLKSCMDIARKSLEGKTAYRYLSLNPKVGDEKDKETIRSLIELYNKIIGRLNEDREFVQVMGIMPRLSKDF